MGEDVPLYCSVVFYNDVITYSRLLGPVLSCLHETCFIDYYKAESKRVSTKSRIVSSNFIVIILLQWRLRVVRHGGN